MKATINGEGRDIPDGTTVGTLLEIWARRVPASPWRATTRSCGAPI